MPLNLRSLRLAATLVVACGVAFGSLPVLAASAAPTATRSTTAAVSDDHGVVSMEGGSAQTSSAARRASYAWTGRRIYYYETIAEKWDWSLRTAINKWNKAGGGIKFVRTTSRSKAKLRITSANIGTAAGEATVGRTRGAYVHLSKAYNYADELDAHYRIEVMMVFAHELGHVLGFHHSSTSCSLMSAMLDVEGCNVIPRVTNPGYYKCRTINGPLVSKFVRVYGGRAKSPASWCPIDKIPAPLTSVAITGGTDSPVTISWTSPASVPSGARVKINTWHSETCDTVPASSSTSYAAVSDGTWQDARAVVGSTGCIRVQLVNRYDAGQSAVARLMTF